MKNKTYKNGFTLLETMIALSVITFAILGPISLASSSLRSATVSKNQIIASFLAKDAMEYIKNWRDNNYLDGKSWLFKLGGSCANASGCYVDTTLPWNDNNAINNCSGDCPFLRYDGSSYNYSVGNETIFRRRYVVDENPVNQEARISITVSWEDKYGLKTFDLEDHLFNWHP